MSNRGWCWFRQGWSRSLSVTLYILTYESMEEEKKWGRNT